MHQFTEPRRSVHFFHTVVNLDDHQFTIDAVLDPNLFKVGAAHDVEQVQVATLDTLTRTKAATLVSRCSEKDLFDLMWLVQHHDLELTELVEFGATIDCGMTFETTLMSVAGTTLSLKGCHFGLHGGPTSEQIFADVSAFKTELERTLSIHLHGGPTPSLGKLVRQLRKWQRS